jgi:hypothetical protein
LGAFWHKIPQLLLLPLCTNRNNWLHAVHVPCSPLNNGGASRQNSDYHITIFKILPFEVANSICSFTGSSPFREREWREERRPAPVNIIYYFIRRSRSQPKVSKQALRKTRIPKGTQNELFTIRYPTTKLQRDGASNTWKLYDLYTISPITTALGTHRRDTCSRALRRLMRQSLPFQAPYMPFVYLCHPCAVSFCAARKLIGKAQASPHFWPSANMKSRRR